MKNRITWTRATGIGRSGWDGMINGKQLFTIERSVVRGEGWRLRTRLPFNIAKDRTVSEDSEALKEIAERVLTAVVSQLGAVFPEEAASQFMGMIETHGRANGPGLWLAATTLDPSLK